MHKKETVDSIIRLIRKEKCNIGEKVVRRIILEMCPSLFSQAYYSVSAKAAKSIAKGKTVFTLSFDCDLERDYEALPLLLRDLGTYGLKASFACIGKWIERLPGIHKEMLQDGHEIINHSYTHPSHASFHPEARFNQLSSLERETEIIEADRTIQNVLGYKPVGFRTPHFGNSHTEDVYNVLERLGYRYSSSTIAINTPAYGNPFRKDNGVWELPLSMDPDNVLSCFDTWSRFKGPNAKYTEKAEKSFFDRLKQITELSIKNRSYVNVYFDPNDIVLLKGFKGFLSYLSELRQEIWFARYEDVVGDLERNR